MMTSKVVLATDNLIKRYGGVVATNNVSLSVLRGELHAVIGPNGAGKTTLIDQLAGESRPTQGKIFFEGADVTRVPGYRRVQRGLVRSFQITCLISDFTVLGNVALAVQSRSEQPLAFWKNAIRDRRLRDRAMMALQAVGLEARAHIRAGELAHGEQRRLEIAMAMALEPTLLLLDEPMAGIGPDEAAAMVDTLRDLKRHCTIVLVEHDMQALFALADRITVLLYGQVLVTGTPFEVRRSPDVQRAYLGTGGEDGA